MPGWYPGPLLQDKSSFMNRAVRLLKHDKSIVREDHLDKRWEEATGEVVDEVIFLSKHTAASNRPALTVHPIGMPHLRQDEVPPAGGKPGWAAPPNPRIGPCLWLLKAIAESHNLTPEFEAVQKSTGRGGMLPKTLL
ncbi:D-aminoacyl-tRNA deacylase-like isoform X2 [Camellia sinensis]|uniref:D-aminoacyl-tRNA deacylase-like isoform X2 n=1 Tax=Camellia sinensis TaxID=4442 RepID=UPI001036C68F|nr:D-aminoacyl-tRNA deacylase-like isoform X2 [Camellia sinensis]